MELANILKQEFSLKQLASVISSFVSVQMWWHCLYPLWLTVPIFICCFILVQFIICSFSNETSFIVWHTRWVVGVSSQMLVLGWAITKEDHPHTHEFLGISSQQQIILFLLGSHIVQLQFISPSVHVSIIGVHFQGLFYALDCYNRFGLDWLSTADLCCVNLFYCYIYCSVSRREITSFQISWCVCQTVHNLCSKW